MFKKNLWIAALIVALSFTALFTGCVDALVVEEDTDTYTEFVLSEFNIWGSNAENQAGWGTDGATYSDGKKKAVSIGLTAEVLQSAKYLVLEMNDGYPKNNVETIYESWAADGSQIASWLQKSDFCSGAGVPVAGMGATKEGNTLTLELSKCVKNYAVFKDKNTAAISLYIQHWGNGGTGAAIKSAKLLIPEYKFIPVEAINIPTTIAGNVDDETTLTATVTPSDATELAIIWSIVGFLPEGATDIPSNWLTIDTNNFATTKAALLAKVDFKPTTIPAKTAPDYSVYPWGTTEVTPAQSSKSPDIIIPRAKGKVRVQATILKGGEDEADFKQLSHDIVVTQIVPYAVPADTAGAFFVDLNQWKTQSPSGVAANADVVPLAVTATGNIVVPFTLENQRINFDFTPAQIGVLETFGATGSVDVTIATTVSGAGDVFRYHIGDATTGSNWNSTGSPTQGAISTILTSTLSFAGGNGAQDPRTPTHFILQHRSADPVTLTISSIKITYNSTGASKAKVDTDADVTITLLGKDATMYGLTNGFIYKAPDNNALQYGGTFPVFKIDLGGGKTLDDVNEIKFNYQGITGDIGWKTFNVGAFDADPSGGNITANALGANALGTFAYSDAGTDLKPITISNGGANGWTISGNEVFIFINTHSEAFNASKGGSTTFKITDIEFVFKN